MKERNLLIGMGTVALVVVVLVWWLEHEENKKLKSLVESKNQDIQDLEINNLQLIQKLIKANPSMSDLVKDQLSDLITSYKVKNPKIAIEIGSVINLIEAEEFEKGVMAIAKIIENILKTKFQKDTSFKQHLINPDGKKRKAAFSEYIDYAEKAKILTKAETHFAQSLREYRNEEAHNLGVKRELNYNLGSMLTGIELMVKCDSYSQNPVTALN
ncbi:MAG: hypothetical protein V4561_10240 [Bacteroidota bacterium]